MAKVKPYLFWIICGVVLLVEIGVIYSISPSLDDPKAKATVQEARTELNGKNSQLQKLVERAERSIGLNDGPTPPFSPAEAANKLKEYIIVDGWKQPLQERVDRIGEQLQNIKRELASRSYLIHDAVSAETDAGAWYADYEAVSGALIKDLVESGLIEAQPNLLPLTDETVKTDRALRGAISLVTTPDDFGQYTSEARRTEVSRSFKLVERVSRVLAGVEGMALPNPIVGAEAPAPELSKPTLEKLEITRAQPDGNPGVYQLRVRLVGTNSALLAAARAVDALSEPISVRLGATWERLPDNAFQPGEKLQKTDLPMRLTFDLMILDFSSEAPRPGEGG